MDLQHEQPVRRTSGGKAPAEAEPFSGGPLVQSLHPDDAVFDDIPVGNVVLDADPGFFAVARPDGRGCVGLEDEAAGLLIGGVVVHGVDGLDHDIPRIRPFVEGVLDGASHGISPGQVRRHLQDHHFVFQQRHGHAVNHRPGAGDAVPPELLPSCITHDHSSVLLLMMSASRLSRDSPIMSTKVLRRSL